MHEQKCSRAKNNQKTNDNQFKKKIVGMNNIFIHIIHFEKKKKLFILLRIGSELNSPELEQL